jgi:PPM family protein phosphatase
MAGLRWGATSDTGRVRSVNQDSVLAELPLFAVADGMGGHAAGEVASQLALGIARQHLGPGGQPSLDVLVDAVAMANRAVFEQARVKAELRGMGTTFCALALLRDGAGERVAVANVGDSRGYVLRGDGLHQLTRDHSYVEDLVEAGEITPLEALSHPQRHIVTRALGVEPNVLVDTWERPAVVGERYLLCSDGLTNELRDPDIEEVLRTQQDPQDAADRLVHLANERGSRDNVSVVVVDVAADGFTGRIEVPAPPVGMRVDELRAMAQAMLPGAALPPPAWTDARPSGVTTLVDDDEPQPAATVAAASGPSPAPAATARSARRRRTAGPTTLRTIVRNVAFFAVLAGIVVFALLSVQAYGRAGWYVTTTQGQITLYQGRADGLLWVKPKAVSRFPLTRSELSTDWQTRLTGRIDFTSRDAAERWYQLLAANPDAVPRLAVTTTTSTAPTSTTTTTTTPGAPTTSATIALPTTVPAATPTLPSLPADEPSTIAP